MQRILELAGPNILDLSTFAQFSWYMKRMAQISIRDRFLVFRKV